jgi:hypothetical protein
MDRLDLQHASCQGIRAQTHSADLSPDAPSAPRRAIPLRWIARIQLAAVLLLLNLLSAGCAHHRLTTRSATLNRHATYGDGVYGPHVEIIRGLGGYMPGSDQLQQRLAARGISSNVSCGIRSHGIARRILARRGSGDGSPIVLIAYATGAHGTMVVADDLAEHGISVDAVILLEPSFFEPVRSNVRYCFVAYKPEPLQQWNAIMRGLPVRVASPATRVTLVNLETIDPGDRLDHKNHLTITTDDWVQQLLVSRAAAAFGCCD